MDFVSESDRGKSRCSTCHATSTDTRRQGLRSSVALSARLSLIVSRQTRVTSDIRIEDGGKLPGQTVFHAAMPFFELGLSTNTIVAVDTWRGNGSS
jgi:hypothetical protein